MSFKCRQELKKNSLKNNSNPGTGELQEQTVIFKTGFNFILNTNSCYFKKKMSYLFYFPMHGVMITRITFFQEEVNLSLGVF